MVNKKTKLIDSFSSKTPVFESDNVAFRQNINPPFKLEGSDQEKQKFCEIINTIALSETGRKTLEFAAKSGYQLKMHFVLGSNGGTSKRDKRIVLSPFENLNVLMGVLIHEARHAGQFERGEEDASDMTLPRKYDIKSEIMKYRCNEADAQATTAQALWEILEQGNVEPFRAFAKSYPEIANKFVNAGIDDENAYKNGVARTAAFLGWYDNSKIKTMYERAYTINAINHHINEETENLDSYNKKTTAAKIINKVCVDEDGKCYFTEDPKIISQGKFVDIAEANKKFLQKYFIGFKQRTGKKPDNSFQKLPTRKDISLRYFATRKARMLALSMTKIRTKSRY